MAQNITSIDFDTRSEYFIPAMLMLHYQAAATSVDPIAPQQSVKVVSTAALRASSWKNAQMEVVVYCDALLTLHAVTYLNES